MPDERPGIRARRIRAESVVDGVQVVGGMGDGNTAHLLALAREVVAGGIDVDDLRARNVISGLQVIRDPSAATLTELLPRG